MSHTVEADPADVRPAGEPSLDAYRELENGVRAALETYSNVHRGSGHNSLVSTRLYEQAREIVLEHLGLDPSRFMVVFCTPKRARVLVERLPAGSFQVVSSDDIGLPLGVRAVAVDRQAIGTSAPGETGGGTARLVAPEWVIWANAPDRFEAGTPAIVNVIALARALRLSHELGADAFRAAPVEKLSARDIVHHDDLEGHSGHDLMIELRQRLVGRGVRVPTEDGARPYVNLDNGASTPTFAPIWDAVRRTWRAPRPVREGIVDEVKAVCAKVLGAPDDEYEVIFTSNTTEAINLLAESLGRSSEPETAPVVVNTLLEHNSNELPWRTVPGSSLLRLTVDSEGFLDPVELEELLRAHNEQGDPAVGRIELVAVSGASNVLGVCNDLAAITRIAHRYGARVLVDAAQLVAHRRIAMADDGIDYLAFSAHKAYAPFGTGVLVARKGLLDFTAAEWGLIRSSGEENVVGIAALGKSLVLLDRIGFDVIQAEEQALTRQALLGLAHLPGVKVFGTADPDSSTFERKGGVIPFSVKGVGPGKVARLLAQRSGIGVRSGCHCAHLLVKRLVGVGPKLEQFQGLMLRAIRRLELPGVVRMSLGIENTAEDVDWFLDVLGGIARSRGDETGPDKLAGSDGAPAMTPKAVQGQIDDFAAAAAEWVYETGSAAAGTAPI